MNWILEHPLIASGGCLCIYPLIFFALGMAFQTYRQRYRIRLERRVEAVHDDGSGEKI